MSIVHGSWQKLCYFLFWFIELWRKWGSHRINVVSPFAHPDWNVTVRNVAILSLAGKAANVLAFIIPCEDKAVSTINFGFLGKVLTVNGKPASTTKLCCTLSIHALNFVIIMSRLKFLNHYYCWMFGCHQYFGHQDSLSESILKADRFLVNNYGRQVWNYTS